MLTRRLARPRVWLTCNSKVADVGIDVLAGFSPAAESLLPLCLWCLSSAATHNGCKCRTPLRTPATCPRSRVRRLGAPYWVRATWFYGWAEEMTPGRCKVPRPPFNTAETSPFRVRETVAGKRTGQETWHRFQQASPRGAGQKLSLSGTGFRGASLALPSSRDCA